MSKKCNGCGVVHINYGGIVSSINGTVINGLSLDGTVLTVSTSDGNKTVDLSPMLPSVVTDLFLKDVKRSDNKIVYTVGEKGNSDNDTTFEIDVSDLAGDSDLAMTLDGTVLHVGGKSVDLQPIVGDKSPDFSNIPEKPFSSGSKIIAVDASGEVYKFGRTTSMFTDVSVEMSSYSHVLQDDGTTEHDVNVTVRNEKDETVPEVEVNIYSDTDITSYDFRANSNITKVEGQNKFNITNLEPYSSITFNVKVKSASNETMSVAVSALGDENTSNNYKSIKLDKRVPQSYNQSYSKECPMISASIDGVALTQSSQSSSVVSRFSASYSALFVNLVENTNLAGKVIDIPDAHSVRVYLSEAEFGKDNNYSFDGVAFIEEVEENKYKSWVVLNRDLAEGTSSNYTFSDGKLTFLTEAKQAIISVRPKGDSCMWQVYAIGTYNGVTSLSFDDDKIGVTGLDSNLYRYVLPDVSYGGEKFKELPVVGYIDNLGANKDNLRVLSTVTNHEYGYNFDMNQGAKYYLSNSTITTKSSLLIELPSGVEYSFSIDKAGMLPEQQGNITTTASGTVKVSSNATATDNVYPSGYQQRVKILMV